MKALIRKPVSILIAGLIVAGCMFATYKHVVEHKIFVVFVETDLPK